ncbi:hypothetical protein CNEO_130104 [Clostridium neonatale]|nr:hypothetical protein CNEO_130104 [Clostridium neonatale]
MYIGTNGMIIFEIIMETIKLNSSKPFNKLLFFTCDKPMPNIKAKTKADIISNIAGISIMK